MSRPLTVFVLATTVVAAAAVATACGTQKISVPRSDAQLYRGAVLFSQRCGGCHTLSYAATHGSAANVATAQANNGPDFDTRCERQANGSGIDRVLYAIANGGMSGAIMPQNVVVGQDAIDVAKFVVTYAGRQAPKIPGVAVCDTLPVGSVNVAFTHTTTTPATATTATTTPRRTKTKVASTKSKAKRP